MVRRTKAQVFKDFPALEIRYIDFVDDDATAEKLRSIHNTYLDMVKQGAKPDFPIDVDPENIETGGSDGKPNMWKILQRMRVISMNPAADIMSELEEELEPSKRAKQSKDLWTQRVQGYVANRNVPTCARFEKVVGLFRGMLARNQRYKTLVFSPFARVNHLLFLRLRSLYKYLCQQVFLISGEMVPVFKDRMNIIEKFRQAPEGSILIATTSVLQEGFDITCASHVIFLGVTWSPINEEQALSRAWRHGQQKKVVVTFLKSDNVIDTMMWKKREQKEKYSKIVVEGEGLPRPPMQGFRDPEISPSDLWPVEKPRFDTPQAEYYRQDLKRFTEDTMPECDMSYGSGLSYGEQQIGCKKLAWEREDSGGSECADSIGKSNID